MITWKRILRALVESCAYLDPIAYTYCAAAEVRAEESARTEKGHAEKQPPISLIEGAAGPARTGVSGAWMGLARRKARGMDAV